MKRKLGLLAVSSVLSVLMVGCMEAANFSRGFLDGYDASSNGFTLIGSSTSQSSCSRACEARGYSYYRYNPNTELCYCK